MNSLLQAVADIWNESGFVRLFTLGTGGNLWERIASGGIGNLIMIAIACILLYLAIKKQFEPLLLLPIAFGMLLVNLPLGEVMKSQFNTLVPLTDQEYANYLKGIFEQSYPVFEMNGQFYWQHFETGGLMWYLYQGVKFGVYPPLIFLGIGAMTDFGPLIANPKSFLLGAAAQLGIFATFFGASAL